MRIDVSQLEFIDQTLRDLLKWVESTTGLEFTITSLYRDKDNGVHGTMPVRGCDLRCRVKVVGEDLEYHINNTWTYDPKRPHLKCAKAHGEGFNFHIHLQVHPNTKG